MPNPFMNIGAMPGGQGMAPTNQSPQPMQGPMAPAPSPVGPPQPMQQPGGQGQMPQQNMPVSFMALANRAQDASRLQSAAEDARNRLRQATIGGAPPSVLSGLQAELASIERELQMSGIRSLYDQQRQQLSQGARLGNIGTGAGENIDTTQRGFNSLDNQFLAALFGMWYGRPSGPPIG